MINPANMLNIIKNTYNIKWCQVIFSIYQRVGKLFIIKIFSAREISDLELRSLSDLIKKGNLVPWLPFGWLNGADERI